MIDWERTQKIPEDKKLDIYCDLLDDKADDIIRQIGNLKDMCLRIEILQAVSIISPFIAVIVLILLLRG